MWEHGHKQNRETTHFLTKKQMKRSIVPRGLVVWWSGSVHAQINFCLYGLFCPFSSPGRGSAGPPSSHLCFCRWDSGIHCLVICSPRLAIPKRCRRPSRLPLTILFSSVYYHPPLSLDRVLWPSHTAFLTLMTGSTLSLLPLLAFTFRIASFVHAYPTS